jgi:hypothetical protein
MRTSGPQLRLVGFRNLDTNQLDRHVSLVHSPSASTAACCQLRRAPLVYPPLSIQFRPCSAQVFDLQGRDRQLITQGQTRLTDSRPICLGQPP